MVIVDGPDGSGKTTLFRSLGFRAEHVKSLRGGIGGTTREGWGGKDPAVKAYVSKIQSILDQPKMGFDRFHLSEVVYGPILRGIQELPYAELTMLNHYLHSHKIPVILCLPPFAVTMANVRLENRERPTFQTEAFLLRAYRQWEKMTPWATIVYDYTRDPLPVI